MQQHVGVDVFRGIVARRAGARRSCSSCTGSSSRSPSHLRVVCDRLLVDSCGQTTPIGLPQWIYVYPLVIGSVFMTLFGAGQRARTGPHDACWGTLVGASRWRSAVVGLERACCPPCHHAVLLLIVGFIG